MNLCWQFCQELLCRPRDRQIDSTTPSQSSAQSIQRPPGGLIVFALCTSSPIWHRKARHIRSSCGWVVRLVTIKSAAAPRRAWFLVAVPAEPVFPAPSIARRPRSRTVTSCPCIPSAPPVEPSGLARWSWRPGRPPRLSSGRGGPCESHRNRGWSCLL